MNFSLIYIVPKLIKKTDIGNAQSTNSRFRLMNGKLNHYKLQVHRFFKD